MLPAMKMLQDHPTQTLMSQLLLERIRCEAVDWRAPVNQDTTKLATARVRTQLTDYNLVCMLLKTSMTC